MDSTRTLDEIVAHRHPVLPNAEHCWVRAIRFEHDLDTHQASLSLRVRNSKTGESHWLEFKNVVFDKNPFQRLNDAAGLYLMTTNHLHWETPQQIELGDWDDGSPLFWAEDVKCQ